MKKLLLTSDSHFLIGHAHFTAGKPCQDHALSSVLGNAAIAVVSDGCSTGGMTDVGSRILSLSTAKALKGHAQLAEGFGPSQIGLVRRDGIKQASIILGLKPDDMLATCIYAYITSGGGFIHLEGDGVIALKYSNGDLKILRYDWADNTPFYAAYSENPNGFIFAHGGDFAAERLTKEVWMKKPDGILMKTESEGITLESGMRGVTVHLSQPEIEDLQHVAIFTDGVLQVEGVEWGEVVTSLLSFKTTEGEFAKRRMNRVVKDAVKKGHGPSDDISYAVINIIKDESEEH